MTVHRLCILFGLMAMAVLVSLPVSEASASSQWCKERFQFSPAAASCIYTWASYNSAAKQCYISTNCNNGYGNYSPTSITVATKDVRKLNNCKGELKVGKC